MTIEETTLDAADVRLLLGHVFENATFAASADIRAQVQGIESVSGPVAMLEIKTRHDVPRADRSDGPLPLVPEVADASGVIIGELLTWLSDGRICALEFAWWSDDAPTALPSVAQLRM